VHPIRRVQMELVAVVAAHGGTPQWVISHLLAILFLHYGFDGLEGANVRAHSVRLVRGRQSSVTGQERERRGHLGRDADRFSACRSDTAPERRKCLLQGC